MTVRRCLLALTIASFAIAFHRADAADEPVQDKAVKFARFKVNDNITFGIVEGDNVREISGTIFGDWKKTEKVHALSDVTLLVPTRPRHVFAMAGNYKSHLQDAEIPPKFRTPQPFFKSPSSLVRHDGWIIIPKDVTLLPGDLIFTGTSGTTSALHPRDVVEVELHGVGILRNRVGRER